MNLKNFNKLLQSRRVPHFAFLSFNPKELFEHYKVSPVTIKRKIRTGALKTLQVVRISSKIQRSIYRSLRKMEKIEPYVIGVSSAPNDSLALETASLINYSLLKRFPNLEWKWINTNYNLKEVDEVEPDLVILYGVIPQYEKLYHIRGILEKYSRSLRIVVVGGTDAISYFDKFLRFPLSGMINLSSVLKPHNETWYSRIESKKNEKNFPVFSKDIERLVKNIKENLDTTIKPNRRKI